MQSNKYNIWDKVYVIDRNHMSINKAIIVKAERSEWAEYQNQMAKTVEEMKRWESYCIEYETRVETLWGMAKWIFREEDLFESEEAWVQSLRSHAEDILKKCNEITDA